MRSNTVVVVVEGPGRRLARPAWPWLAVLLAPAALLLLLYWRRGRG